MWEYRVVLWGQLMVLALTLCSKQLPQIPGVCGSVRVAFNSTQIHALSQELLGMRSLANKTSNSDTKATQKLHAIITLLHETICLALHA